MHALTNDPVLTLAALNRMTAREFGDALADIYEHSPWIAHATAAGRPFATIDALADAMAAVVLRADRQRQRALLNAHPMLGRPAGLTPASNQEQQAAGFSRLDQAEAERLDALNEAYQARFGFPFIIAVRGQKDSRAIIGQLEARLRHTPDEEEDMALREVIRIAGFRLQRSVSETTPALS
jgi:2-oxo-4-hydroxy-4-carboxy-5-ureidoimidazoline decarboxylase